MEAELTPTTKLDSKRDDVLYMPQYPQLLLAYPSYHIQVSPTVVICCNLILAVANGIWYLQAQTFKNKQKNRISEYPK